MFISSLVFLCAAFFFRFYSLFVFNFENLVDSNLPKNAFYDFIIGKCQKQSTFVTKMFVIVCFQWVLAQPVL